MFDVFKRLVRGLLPRPPARSTCRWPMPVDNGVYAGCSPCITLMGGRHVDL